MFLEHQMISEGSLTLKNGEMVAENFAITEIIYILKYIK